MAKFTDVISGLTESTDPQGDSDYIVGYDGSAVVKYLINNLPFATSTLALDELGAPSDSTSLDASTDAHGLLPKLDGTSTNYLNGTGAWSVPAGGGTSYDYILIQDQKAQNTDGGTFTSGAWQTRTLNTEVVDSGNNASISSNQITLAAGTYVINASAPAWHVKRHQARFQNISDSDTEITGTCEIGENSGYYSQTRSFVSGRFTIEDTKIFELQHRCEATEADTGFGEGSNFGTEIYSSVELWKVE